MKTPSVNLRILAVSTLMILAAAAPAWAQSQELLFKAMQDELERSIAELRMEELDRPYYLSYTIDDMQTLMVRGTLGTLLSSNLEHDRYVTVDARVGDYSLDNANFVSGWRDLSPSYRRIPVGNDYDAIRNQIYLATDQAYKEALKTLSRKKAYLQSRVIKNRPADLIKLPVNRLKDKAERFDVERAAVERLVTAASAVFRDYPMIVSSELRIEVGIFNQYLVNSLGSKVLRGDRSYVVDLSLSGKNPDGEDVSYADRLLTAKPSELPGEPELIRWATERAETMKSLIAADTIEEYIGPVIFTGDAAGEFLRQLFAKNVSNLPSPIVEDERFGSMIGNPEFANKVNRRVLPAFFNVYDDPTLQEFAGQELIGHYEVDDAGVVPTRVQLVENGKLRNLPIGMSPTKKIKEANGHARGALSKQVTAKPGNLIFESADQVSYDDLKRNLLELCQDIDLEYGLVIKRIRDLNDPDGRQRFSFFGMSGGSEPGLTAPLAVYKVFADGREVPVRGLEFANVTVRHLRDILQTDDRTHVYNYLIAGDYEMPASIVCPSILLEEIELKQQEAKTEKPPILASPLAEN